MLLAMTLAKSKTSKAVAKSLSKAAAKAAAKLNFEKRAHLRFKPDLGDYGLIDLEPNKNFAPSIMALLLNESYSGCAMLTVLEKPIDKGMKVKVKAGRLAEMMAEVMWIHPIDENIFKIGFRYLE
jgi:hypothetical protein